MRPIAGCAQVHEGFPLFPSSCVGVKVGDVQKRTCFVFAAAFPRALLTHWLRFVRGFGPVLGVAAAGLVLAGVAGASITVWKVQHSPNPSAKSELLGVAATSSSNAWAVGYYVKTTLNIP